MLNAVISLKYTHPTSAKICPLSFKFANMHKLTNTCPYDSHIHKSTFKSPPIVDAFSVGGLFDTSRCRGLSSIIGRVQGGLGPSSIFHFHPTFGSHGQRASSTVNTRKPLIAVYSGRLVLFLRYVHS